MTFEVILYQMENLCLHNVGISIRFYQNRFINESVRDNLANIPQSHSLIDFLWHIEEPTFIEESVKLIYINCIFAIDRMYSYMYV